jgi:hypothetical protein
MPSKITGFYKTFNCRICGKECTVWVHQSALKNRNKKFEFCSRKCSAARNIREDVPCAHCGKLFHPTKDVRYCSRECFALSTRGRKAHNAFSQDVNNYIQKHYPNSDPNNIAKVLNMTADAVRRVAYKLGLKINKEVKSQNISKYTAHHMQGENNPNWQGGGFVAEWGKNWYQQRNAARKRDNYTCQICGYYTRSIAVHHIKPRRFFLGHMEDANVLSNLICLCSTHHLLVEMGKIPCPKPKS